MTNEALIPTVAPDLPAPVGAVNLTNCDREPIHIPGSVQPHGVLLEIDTALTILIVSGNVGALTGNKPDQVLGRDLSVLLDDASVAIVRDACCGDEVARENPYRLRARHTHGVQAWNGILHRHERRTILELEPRSETDLSYRECFEHVRRLTQALQGARTHEDALSATVAEVRRLTGFGHVLIYRFLPDAAGQCVAEDRDDDMPSYVGLHFPASDVPAQARALYVRNPSRLIADAAYEPAPLLSLPGVDARHLDLSFATLRSVSPIHREYLGNMGVRASMSASIIRDGKLWGLLSCMDRDARPVGFETRQAFELMAQALAWQISVLEEMEDAQHGARVRALQARLAVDLGAAPDPHAALVQNKAAVLDAVRAEGAILCLGDNLTAVGVTPPTDTVRVLRDWLTHRAPNEVYHTDHLAAEWPAGETIQAQASGLLAVPLSRAGADMILWFRPELPQIVRWGGDPNKVASDADSGRIHPRKSFAAWSEQLRGHSGQWNRGEVAAAMSFRDLAIDAIVRRSVELHRANEAILRASDQLETFVQVASHDLLEPARQVETLTDILQGMMPDDMLKETEINEVMHGIRGVSGRLRQMLLDLSDYSKVSSGAEPFEPVDLDEVAQEILGDLHASIEAAGARIVTESLPSLVCDRRQIRHVLLNMIQNALKYRSDTRRPEIRIYGETARVTDHQVDAGPARSNQPGNLAVSVCVADNGIGFDPRYATRIFEPFQRLHTSHRYGGSGVGLAICRKIIERHGGSISAEGRPQEGSLFRFTLPVRGAYPVSA